MGIEWPGRLPATPAAGTIRRYAIRQGLSGMRIFPWLAVFALTGAAFAASAAAPQVACRYTYGGESQWLLAGAVASPYTVPSIKVGSYFRFRVVFQQHPADLASIKVYTYADRDDGPVLIHQANYRYPPSAPADAPYGFTGQQFVYEPVRDGELEYWCRMQTTGMP